MVHILGRRSTHAHRLERWLGANECERLSESMRTWPGPPIAVAGVPGRVYVRGGGDFVGAIDGGHFARASDWARDKMRRLLRLASLRQRTTMAAGFSSLSDLISEATTGAKSRKFYFAKSAVTLGGGLGAGSSFFTAGQPAAAAAPAGVAGGTVYDDSSAGGSPFTNPTGGDTQHFVGGWMVASTAGCPTLLYDRLFAVNKTMSSSGAEAVTGVPTRYQSTTPSDPDYAGGNFCTVEITTGIAAIAHNWNVCQYTDQAGNAANSFPSAAGVSGLGANRIDLAPPNWFMPLAAGDSGVKAITQMQCSTALLTGQVDFMIGHPIAMFPGFDSNTMVCVDGVNSAFNLERIFDDACLALLHPLSANSPTSFNGMVRTVAG